MGLSLKLLGEFALHDENGAALSLPTRKTRALLGYLAANMDKPQSRERLMALLWSSFGEKQARHNLNQALLSLRKLGLPLESDGERVELCSEAMEIDLARFQAMQDTDPAQAAKLYEGPFLDGLTIPDPAFEDWIAATRTALHDQVCNALEHATDAATGKGDTDAAVAAARRLLTLDPLREDAHRRLMRLLRDSGDRVGALRQYQACAEILQEELQVSPDTATQTLFEEIRGDAKSDSNAAPSAATFEQSIQFCTAADGVQIAYATLGRGPGVVIVSNWLTHLELDKNLPKRKALIQRLVPDHMVVRFDARGNGLSDWDVGDFSFEASVGDLGTVIAASGLDRVALIGESQGAAIATAYAARHPDKVTHLVLYGGYARGRRRRGSDRETAESDALITLIREGWGKNLDAYVQMLGVLFMPDATSEQLSKFTELQRKATPPENAARIHRALDDIDISSELPNIVAPTLVLHVREDARAPFDEGRRMAATIAHARFVPLEGRNHVLLDGEPAFVRYLEEVEAFLKS